MSTNSIINSVRQYLISQHIYADDEWLTGCVEYLTEDSSNLSEADIKNLAKEQWLLNDLKEICPGSLPPNLKDKKKIILQGRFVLQINAVMDIGTPAYQQYLKLQKVNMENVEATTQFEDKISSHRMIKLFITDGVQDISAIEYKPMRNISCDITPGCKMLVKGPVECRRGVLLLTENSIELLGGEVTEYAVSNSLAGLLSSKLGVQIDADQNTTIMQPNNTNIPTLHTQMPPARLDDPMQELSRPIARVTSVQATVDDDIDFDDIAAIEAQYCVPTKRPLAEPDKQPDKKLKPSVNKPDDYPDDNDFIFDEDEDYLREVEAQFDQQKEELPRLVSVEPFTYIKLIKDMKNAESAGRVFKVKAQIMKLLSKLSVGKDGWSLRCTIIDGTGSLDVDFTSDVLSKLVGFTPQEMNQMKRQMSSDPAVKEKAVAALQKAKETLQVLYCIIELTILECPKITALVPFDEEHAAMLKERARACHGL